MSMPSQPFGKDIRIPAKDEPEVHRLLDRLAASPWPEGVDPCRVHYDGRGAPIDPAVSQDRIDANGVPCLLLTPDRSHCDVSVLFLHGGGYVFGSTKSHGGMAAQIALRLKGQVLAADYRRAPEAPCPAAIEDAVAAYRWLLESGRKPEKIAIVGDSAGGGLMVAALQAARDLGLPMPAACVALSPWVDLTMSGRSLICRAGIDPEVERKVVAFVAENYLNGRAGNDPQASPIYGDLKGLPPMLIQVGEREILFSDAAMLRDRARADGVDVIFEEWLGLFHVFQFYFQDLSDARLALDRLSDFLSSQLDMRVAIPAE